MKRNASRAVLQRLESLQRAGITHLKRVPRQAPPLAGKPAVGHSPSQIALPAKSAPQPAETTKARSATAEKERAADKLPADRRAAALAEVACDVAACTRCGELARTRTQTVFGVGNPYARLVFCGEAPGADEDRLGEPFVGRAGQLLTDIIVKGMKMRREDVYILNILRCRPPGNRNPLPIEAANCREYLDRQLAIIQPEFICCLGAVAAQNLLGTDVPIGRLRGRVHDLNGVKVVCTYHPAYLLRNPDAKRYVWDDIKLLMAEMAKDK
jgi:uracil-DNA glycosylase